VNVRWPHGDPRDVARTVLADPRFHAAASGPQPKPWWQLLLDALHALWDRLFGPFGKLVSNETVSNIIGLAVLIAAAGLLIYVAYRFGRRWSRVRPVRRGGVAAIALDEEADARTLRVRAHQAFAEARYHDAAALLWLSALRALDERGQVRYDPSRTPGEWRRVVHDPAFDVLARDAVIAFFGEGGVDAELVGRMGDAYDRIVPA